MSDARWDDIRSVEIQKIQQKFVDQQLVSVLKRKRKVYLWKGHVTQYKKMHLAMRVQLDRKCFLFKVIRGCKLR